MSETKKPAGEVCRACGRLLNGQNPNVVSLKFLAELIGQRVRIRCDAWGAGFRNPLEYGGCVIGTLRRFDNYSMVVSPEDADGKPLPDMLIFKGPGLMVQAEPERAA